MYKCNIVNVNNDPKTAKEHSSKRIVNKAACKNADIANQILYEENIQPIYDHANNMIRTNSKLEKNLIIKTEENNYESSEDIIDLIINPLSDSKLYEMASNYITTDESLENFQQNYLKNNITEKKHFDSYNNSNTINKLNCEVNDNQININDCDNEYDFINKHQRKANSILSKENLDNKSCCSFTRLDRLSKNICKNLEYYEHIE